MGNTESQQPSPSTTPDFNPEYEVVKKILDGHYGDVKIVKDTKEETEMILKEVNIDTTEEYEKVLESYNRRVTVSHPNLIRVIGYTSSSQQGFCSSHYRVNVFIEVVEKDLDLELKDRIASRTPFTENELLLVAENLINGLSYYQGQEVTHGDIRPFNIFMTKDNSFKLSDPTLSSNKQNGLAAAILGTAKTYLTPDTITAIPEQEFEKEHDQYKSDVYALGMTLLALGTLSQSEDIYNYDEGKMDLEMLEGRLELLRNNYSNFTYELIRDMLNENEEERPEFIALSNKFVPYQDDIRKGVDLPFFKSGGIKKVAGGYAGEDALTRAQNQLAKSLQMRDGQNHESYNSGALDDLDARIKAALERSQNTFKQIFGEDHKLAEIKTEKKQEESGEVIEVRQPIEVQPEEEVQAENKPQEEEQQPVEAQEAENKPVEEPEQQQQEQKQQQQDNEEANADANEKPVEQENNNEAVQEEKLAPYDNLVKDQEAPADDSNVVNTFVAPEENAENQN